MPLEFLSYGSDKDVFCHVNEATFGPCVRMKAGCQGNQSSDKRVGTSVSLPDLRGGEMDWRLNQFPVANGLISHDYVMKLP